MRAVNVGQPYLGILPDMKSIPYRAWTSSFGISRSCSYNKCILHFSFPKACHRNRQMSDSQQKGRIYKSRKSRPCDACRRRKVTCDMLNARHASDVYMNKACTLEEPPASGKDTPHRNLTISNHQYCLCFMVPRMIFGVDLQLMPCRHCKCIMTGCSSVVLVQGVTRICRQSAYICRV